MHAPPRVITLPLAPPTSPLDVAAPNSSTTDIAFVLNHCDWNQCLNILKPDDAFIIPAWDPSVAYAIHAGITLYFLKSIELPTSTLLALDTHIRTQFTKLDPKYIAILGYADCFRHRLLWTGPLENEQARQFIDSCGEVVEEASLKRSPEGKRFLGMISSLMQESIEDDWDKIVARCINVAADFDDGCFAPPPPPPSTPVHSTTLPRMKRKLEHSDGGMPPPLKQRVGSALEYVSAVGML